MIVDCVITDRCELEEFVDTVASVAGDPAEATAILFVHFGASPDPGAIVATWSGRDTLFLELDPGIVYPLELDVDGPRMDSLGLKAFRPKKVRPGVWSLTPSFNLAGVLHAFVVVHGVPDPAPWERLVILASF